MLKLIVIIGGHSHKENHMNHGINCSLAIQNDHP